MRLIDADALIDALHTWFRDGFDEDKWWNSTHVLAAIEGLPSAQQGYKWETCFECPLSHGCPKIKGCTNEQAIEYASQIPNDCPLSVQPDHVADIGKKASISCGHENDLTSRQAALKELAVYIHLIDKTMGKGILTYDDCMEAAKSVLGEDELPAVQQEQKWIPCSKRFPEYNESVLTWDGYAFCIEKRIPYIRDDDGEPIEGDWWVSDEYDEYESECYPNLRDGAAIAWMPLPKPYRGGGQDDR